MGDLLYGERECAFLHRCNGYIGVLDFGGLLPLNAFPFIAIAIAIAHPGTPDSVSLMDDVV